MFALNVFFFFSFLWAEEKKRHCDKEIVPLDVRLNLLLLAIGMQSKLNTKLADWEFPTLLACLHVILSLDYDFSMTMTMLSMTDKVLNTKQQEKYLTISENTCCKNSIAFPSYMTVTVCICREERF